ncbi:g10754 [Coccomyxa viridis]|uniref:E3 ubiquitin-protein ligase CHFR n=1 Tax=Coccomyxa viridis TaxID=1274662 RepID=A0ABP1GC35_9CHLO
MKVLHKEKGQELSQEDEAVPSTCAAPVRGDSGDLGDPLSDTKTSRWDLPESISMPEPLHARRRSINHMMSLSLRRLEVKKELFAAAAAQTEPAVPAVWGWLEPGSPTLPHIQLQGNAIALGRGSGRQSIDAKCGAMAKSAFAVEYSLPEGSGSPSVPPSPRAIWSKDLTFVEVQDGRVSRLHCILHPDKATSPEAGEPTVAGGARLLDCSSNGTFVNGEPVSRDGTGTLMCNGDRLSLVLSVTPLVEHFFIYHGGEPPMDSLIEWSPVRSIAAAAAEDQQQLASQAANELRMRSLQRMATSKYTTADASTLEDFQCQICLSTLRDCVAIEPCGHNFCASCLSHHFASQLLVSSSLSCPLRCTPPARIVMNTAVRRLIQRLHIAPAALQQGPRTLQQTTAGPGLAEPGHACEGAAPEHSDGEGEVHMSRVCPLDDNLLPIAADGLRLKQVEALLRQIQDADKDADVVIVALETLAKIAWNDDEVRAEVGQYNGVEVIVKAMKLWASSGGVQCNGCLAIVSLVRAESEVCQANQWLVAKSGGLEVIASAMRGWRDYPMVQLCALLCMVPLALDNTVLQAHLAQLALGDIFAALEVHQDQSDLQAKGLVALGVLGQGDGATHDHIRSMQLQIGVPKAIARALQQWGSSSDEVIWAALFALAVLVREGSTPHSPALRAIAAAGVLPILQTVLSNYKERAALREGSGDEMIISAGDFLVHALKPAARRLAWERSALCGMAFAAIGLFAWRSRTKAP